MTHPDPSHSIGRTHPALMVTSYIGSRKRRVTAGRIIRDGGSTEMAQDPQNVADLIIDLGTAFFG